MSDDVCCEPWRTAQLDGTDSEAYGRLLSNYGGEWHMGSDLPEVRFCPWCGARKGVQ